jgi:hypothetical protein
MQFLTREVFDAVIIGVIIVGLVAAFFRLRADLRRNVLPPPDWEQFQFEDDTQPNERQQ